ncbi:hypothetical protein SSP24_36810 [Streptomyces spinoverrucosus]|uniref:Secreted protein n=1 Tax=Streptomyces spinoverrucosus TaxID=284043 RepID=A0A4Y3VLW7_9ACTN|nr:hypothetical protein [Streptomyces spinoverrucosus]GEC06026.1 hypothetical protein SSP24_36810 [Streptomyces spinoverrucosus]GHB73774.1 hypothetical protein GCM10010397_50060 [Streptomyces spinoverrucosus]
MKALSAIAARPQRRRITGTLLVAAVAGALTWLAAPAGTSANADAHVAAPVAGEAPGYGVEDFNYPQADKILAEKNIVLKRGDGHITLADCVSGTGQLEVWARSKDKICFQVTGNSGWLTLEIPSVYGIKGNDYATQVDMTTGTEEKSFDINKNTWTPVGESADEQGREFMLVEIRTAK